MAQVSRYYYSEEGNAAHRLMPEREWEIERERQREEKRQRQRELKRAQARARAVAGRRCLSVGLIMGVITFLFVMELGLQSSISESMRSIASMQTEITELKAENSATENRIHTNANLQTVKAKAASELGMVYANNDQIVYYSMDDTDYMNQYDDIP